MVKTLTAANQSERDKLKIPRSVQQSIPIKAVYPDGIWTVGRKHSRSWKLTDVNYVAASPEAQRSIITAYCGAINTMPTDATTKITSGEIVVDTAFGDNAADVEAIREGARP